MSKYHQLVKKYESEIAEIKSLKAKIDALRDEIAEIDPMENATYDEDRGWMPDFNALDKIGSVEDQIIELNDKLAMMLSGLDIDIDQEYAAVPYRKPAVAGKNGFYRESGLADLFSQRYR